MGRSSASSRRLICPPYFHSFLGSPAVFHGRDSPLFGRQRAVLEISTRSYERPQRCPDPTPPGAADRLGRGRLGHSERVDGRGAHAPSVALGRRRGDGQPRVAGALPLADAVDLSGHREDRRQTWYSRVRRTRRGGLGDHSFAQYESALQGVVESARGARAALLCAGLAGVGPG